MSGCRVVVLGGYGHFGGIAARRLAAQAGFDVVVAGRDGARANAAAQVLRCEAAVLDRADPGLADRLRALRADIVIDTAGPFQGRDYAVPMAAGLAGAHCVDIADARAYVTGIASLSALARERRVWLVSGASSVPALTSAVVDHLVRGLETVERIDMGITTSGRLPGDATLDAVLAYSGRSIPAWRDSKAACGRGWAGLRRRHVAGLGARWFVDADVPDLELLPARFPGLRELRFGAGSESRAVVWGTWVWACARAAHLVPPVMRVPRVLSAAWRAHAPSSGRSALFVEVHGRGADRVLRRRTWTLVASGEDGAEVPVLPAIAMARKLARGEAAGGRALSCVGLLSVDEILAEKAGLRVAVHQHEEAA